MQFKQLNKVSVIYIFASEVSLLVKSSCSTLTELVIQGMKEDSPHTFPESNAILNLEFFQCSSLKILKSDTKTGLVYNCFGGGYHYPPKRNRP